MSTIKFILPLFWLTAMPFLACCQNPVIDCSRDSAAYMALSKMLDTTRISNIQNLDLLSYTIFSPGKKRDCFCDLLIYARVYDFLLEKGLTLNYQVAQNPPLHSSTIAPPPAEQVISNNKYNIFRQFLKVKKAYENSVLKSYNNDKRRMLAQDVDNLIKYHIYAYPNTLKDILLAKYTHLTLEKLQAEVYRFYGDPASKH